ncbi:MAG: bifunctional metallophosphatase/5'-nucleotidase [Bacteroidales bacterium]
MKKLIPFPVCFVIILMLMPMQIFSQSQRFTLLHTSDEHSVLSPLPAADYHPWESNPSLGGFARLAGMVNQIRAQKGEEPVLLLSSGDFIGGSPYAWLILEGYSPEIELMKEIGYDAVTIGNHEFDYGPDVLADYFKRLGYPQSHSRLPLLIANLEIPEGHALEQVEFLPRKIIELSNGLRVGVFGLLGEDAYSVAPMADPVKVSDPVAMAQKQADLLKEEGANIVVLLSHSGLREDRLIARTVSNIDVLLGGHDHYQTLEPEIINNTIMLHSSYYLRNLGMLELEYDPGSQTLSLVNEVNGNPYQIPLNAEVAEDQEVLQRVGYFTHRLNDFLVNFTDSLFTNAYAHILYSSFPLKKHADLQETTVGNFVVDAMRLEAQKVTGRRVDIAIQANGVIRGDIIPGTMPWSQNRVSFMDLVTISGLGSGPDMRPGYPMVSIYLTAQEVYNILEIAGLLSRLMGDMYFLQFSGLKYTYDPGKITWLTIPFAGIPVPAYRSVQEVHLFTGEGIQREGEYEKLRKDDPRLFHLVADHYLTSFLPMIGEILPKLKLVLKDKDGQPLELDQTIIYHNGQEFKVWEAVARYAMSFEANEHGLPVMPAVYQQTQGRIVEEKGMPLYVLSYMVLAGVLVGFAALIRWAIKRKRKGKK